MTILWRNEKGEFKWTEAGETSEGDSVDELKRALQDAERLLRTWPMAACIKFGMAEIDSPRSIAAKRRMDEYDAEVRAFLSQRAGER